jgi:transcriptional regulator with XRE-family HTH domain
VANERLRSRITGARLTIAEVAAQVGVDPKTVERWIILGRIPHRSHRWATASLLGTDEAYLWPELADERRTQAASTSELVTLYPNRGAVPGALWRSLLESAADRIDVLVYAGLFLPDGYPEIAKLLATKAEQGEQGPPCPGRSGLRGGASTGRRGRHRRCLAARVRLGLLYLREAIGAPGVELRFHATTLYN